MTIDQIAAITIPAARNTQVVKYANGVTGDIMKETFAAFNETNGDVKDLAPYLRAGTIEETCRRIFNVIKNNIRYREDPRGKQWVREPRRLWSDKVGDCKSYAVFAASCLKQMGIEGYFRFVAFKGDNSIPTHVYVVVPDRNGREIIIDPALPGGRFNQENRSYTDKYDYTMTQISRLGAAPKQKQVRIIGRTTRKGVGFATLGCNCGIGTATPGLQDADQSSGAKLFKAAIPFIKNFVSNLFGGVDKTRDWENWDYSDANEWHVPMGNHVVMYLVRSDDDNRRSAINIMNYINSKNGDLSWLVGRCWSGKETGNRSICITPQVIMDKFNRAGFSAEGKQLAAAYQIAVDQKNGTVPSRETIENLGINYNDYLNQYKEATNTNTGTGNYTQPAPVNQAGVSPWLMGGLALAAVAAVTMGKKKK